MTKKSTLRTFHIFPQLTYPLQAAPLHKIPKMVTDGIDVLIRQCVKGIIGLPTTTVTDMFYSPRKYRGLALLCCQWEKYLQHFAIANKLKNLDDELLHQACDFQSEIDECLSTLSVTGQTSRHLRNELRNRSFETWCSRQWQGIGVKHFKTHTKTNSFIYDKNTLSSSEWTAAIKLNCNYANLLGVPGNGERNEPNLCRRCGRERETPSHVLGSCPFNDNHRTARHHRVKHSINSEMKRKDFICFDEAYAIDTELRHRFSDIIAIDRKSNNAYIIDPTVRYENNHDDQDEQINLEKVSIYERCIPYYKQKFKEYGNREWSVIGLWFGSRGTVSSSVINFFDKFDLDKAALIKIAETVLIDSIQIINRHIYS